MKMGYTLRALWNKKNNIKQMKQIKSHIRVVGTAKVNKINQIIVKKNIESKKASY